MPVIELLSRQDRPKGDTAPPTCWRSLHLFLNADSESPLKVADRVLLEVVAPLARACLSSGQVGRYFFIRYSELGLHLRLRLEGDPAVLDGPVRDRLEADLVLGPEQTDGLGTFQPSAVDGLRHVRFVPYEPEASRYGGRHGVHLAEDLFFASSTLVLELLRGVEDGAGRSARALLAMVVSAHALAGAEDPAALLSDYEEAVLAYLDAGRDRARDAVNPRSFFDARCQHQPPALLQAVQTLWQRLQDGRAPAPFAVYHDRCVTARRQLEAAVRAGRLGDEGGPFTRFGAAMQHLIPSYLHMTSNRMGIDLLEEAFLAHLARHVLWPDDRGHTVSEP